MSRPIYLTEELKRQALEEFSKSLASLKMSDGKVTYNKSFTYKGDDKAVVLFTPVAYAKMVGLIMSFDSEVAWHGVGHRVKGEDGVYLIEDILVYPQTVSGSTVEMDTEAYAKWIMENDEDERFNNIIMQGHSHVNFSTTPSSVDTNHQESILDQLKDGFYIFLIWNKKLEHNTKIYDLDTNTLYENADISYGITSEEYDFAGFIDEAKSRVVKKVVQPTYAYQGGYNYGDGAKYSGGSYNGGTKPATTPVTTPTTPATTGKTKAKQKGKAEVGSGWNGRGSGSMEDEADDYMAELRDRFNT